MNPLVSGPVLGTLLRLTWPNLVAMGSLMFVSVAETWIVGRIGLSSLAAMSLVFPLIILMQNLAGGSIGGSVAALVSRELGRGRPDEASAVAVHGLVIALVLGVAFLLFFLTQGPWLYRLLGAKTDEVLSIADGYSSALAFVLPVMWWWMVLSAVLRGVGNMWVPARLTLIAAVIQPLLGVALALGIGPLPALGMIGVAIGQIVPSLLCALFGLWYVADGRAAVGFTVDGRLPRLRFATFAEILKLGGMSSLQTMQSMVIVMGVGRLVAEFGVEALAAYGIGARLEVLLMNVVWAVGVASVPLIGMSIGAGNAPRARRAAWTASVVAATMMLAIGGTLALLPELWLRLFTDDPATLDAGRRYLHRVGPCLVFLGLGGALYFSSQGAGHLLGPLLASTTRLLVVVGGGMLLQARGASLDALFMMIGVGMAIYGIGTMLAVRLTRWGARQAPAARTEAEAAAG
ncbi:MAG: MATE family efflux transporter [Burkholderiaceae bacterium]